MFRWFGLVFVLSVVEGFAVVSVPRFEIVSGYTDVCPCLFAFSGCYSCFVEDAAL